MDYTERERLKKDILPYLEEHLKPSRLEHTMNVTKLAIEMAEKFGADKNKLLKMALKAFGDKYEREFIEKWLGVFMKRFFISQFKRSCIPDSPKVGSVSLSPRGDWRMPSDASFAAFM